MGIGYFRYSTLSTLWYAQITFENVEQQIRVHPCSVDTFEVNLCCVVLCQPDTHITHDTSILCTF